MQEYRAKRTLDQLAVLNAPIARVVRDGALDESRSRTWSSTTCSSSAPAIRCPADGDGALVRRSRDRRVAAHRRVRPDPQGARRRGAVRQRSSSRAVAGSRRPRSAPTPTPAKLATEARRFTVTHSELVAGINQILRYVTWVIVTIGPLLFLRQLQDQTVAEAITGTVAGVVLMVPEGLVLLTSIAFGLAAVTLARRQVLVQELPAVEASRASTWCASTRPAPSPRAIVVRAHRACSTRRRDDEPSPARSARCADDETPTRRWTRSPSAFPAPDGWTRARVDAVLVGAQVERGELRRARLVGARRARDGAGSTPADDPVRRQRRRARRRPAAGCLLLRPSADALAGEELPPGARTRSRSCCSRRRSAPTPRTRSHYFDQPGRRRSRSSRATTRAPSARSPGGSACPTPTTPSTPASCPRTSSELAEVLERALGVRPGHAAPEAGDGQRAAVARARRRDDRRRRQRRARAEGRRHRRRDGLRRGRDPRRRAARAARQRVRHAARRRRRGPAGDRQHRAGRRTCSSPRRLRRAARDRRR